MYMSAGISCMHLWQTSVWKGRDEKTCFAFTGRAGSQFKVKKCETQSF